MELVITQSFKDRVERTGMTQEALAKAVGVSRQFFNAVLNGRTQPTTAFMVGALKAGLGNQLTDIAEWTASKPAEKKMTA